MSAHVEEEMRDVEAPQPQTPEELIAYIESLVAGDHDYGTCVYAMSLAATAAFNYVASELGVTGFQAQCADMDVLRRTRGYKGPFMLIDGANALYPQYDLPKRLAEAMEEWKPWLAEQAAKLIAEERDFESVHPDVLAHWKSLAGGAA